MEIINVNCNGFLAYISAACWTQYRMLKHFWMKSEVSSVQNSSHLTFKQKHDSAWAVIRIHKNHRYAFFFVGIAIFGIRSGTLQKKNTVSDEDDLPTQAPSIADAVWVGVTMTTSSTTVYVCWSRLTARNSQRSRCLHGG